MRSLFWVLYQLATGLSLVTAGPFLLARRGRHYLATLPDRLLARRARPAEPGSPDAPHGQGGLWLHAVSVGEAGVAATLAGALPPALPLVVTTITPTGQARALAALGSRAAVAYLPFDLGWPVRRFFAHFRPRVLVLVEGDYWPLVLREARRRQVAVVVVNGRVSDRSFRRLCRLRPLLAPLLLAVDRFGMQTGEDRDKLVSLGVPAERVTVTGNLKYDSPEPPRQPALEAALARLAGGRPILLAGSTMAGEEEIVLNAFRRLGGGGGALLVLAPRHPERWGEVARLLAVAGVATLRRSGLRLGAGSGESWPASPPPAVLLLDSLGELAGLYAVASAAFIGGTLVPTGGHNPLEPARYGVPTAIGPSMENFRDIAERFDRAGAWCRVATGEELAAAWGAWLADREAGRALGARAARLVAENRGALAATLDLLRPLLAGVESAA